MAISQMELIQSLGEAMSWFQREISWGVPPTELRHLCGRIGELYAAIITNGQMADKVNQKGYDVVSALNERVSVKTTAIVGFNGHISFNHNSLEFVDRVIILRIDIEEKQIETLLDASVADAIKLMSHDNTSKRVISLSKLFKKPKPKSEIKTMNEVCFQNYLVRELENGSIEVELAGRIISPVKPALRELASLLNISLVNTNGNTFNTRQLGSLIIKNIIELTETTSPILIDL